MEFTLASGSLLSFQGRREDEDSRIVLIASPLAFILSSCSRGEAR